MALSKSLTQPFRKNMLLIGAGWRAFFAPWDSVSQANNPTSGGPTIADLSKQGPFNTNNVPPNFFDCGWVREFKVSPQSKIGQVRSGYRGAVRQQYRGEVGLQFDITFREHGRLQYQLASGTQVYNILQTAAAQPSTTSPIADPGSPSPAVAMGASGYVASGTIAGFVGQPTLYVPSGSGGLFPANTYIVDDIDFVAGQSGLLGENGAFGYPNAITDVDWIRKTSSYVARVTAVVTAANNGSNPAQDALILDQPFYGGGSPAATTGKPPATAKVQIVLGWVAREGGTFIQEWSGLFVSDSIDGAQAVIYIPHVSPLAFKGMNQWTLENAGTTDLAGEELPASFEALAFDDPEDGETVVSYTSFYVGSRIQNLY